MTVKITIWNDEEVSNSNRCEVHVIQRPGGRVVGFQRLKPGESYSTYVWTGQYIQVHHDDGLGDSMRDDFGEFLGGETGCLNKNMSEALGLRAQLADALAKSREWMHKHDELLSFIQARPAILSELIDQNSYADLRASGGIADAP